MPIAHAGHWLVQVAYFLPVLLFLIWLGVTVVRDRREDSEPGAPDGAAEGAGAGEQPAGGGRHEADATGPNSN